MENTKSVEKFQNVKFTCKSNSYNLFSKYSEDSLLCEKLEIEEEKKSTDLNADIESAMNKAGIFDDEINKLDKETIQDLNSAYSCSVQVMYYEEDKTGELSLMDNNEIEQFVDEQYGEEIQKNRTSFLDKLLKNTIFSKITVNAKTQADINESPSGKFKHVLWCTQTSENSDIKVTYSGIWLKRPKYKRKDVMGIYLKNATPKGSTWSGVHACEYCDNNKNEYKTFEKNISNKIQSPDGMAIRFNLFDTNLVDIKDERIILKFMCCIDNKKIDHIVACGKYFHCKSNATYSPGVAISKDGISLSCSASVQEKYSEVKNNPLVILYCL